MQFSTGQCQFNKTNTICNSGVLSRHSQLRSQATINGIIKSINKWWCKLCSV